MAAPSWESKGADFSNTSAAPSFAVPAGTASGKIVVVSMFVNVKTTTVDGVPAGFASVPGSPVLGKSNGTHKFWKRLTGADAGTYDFILSSSQFVEGSAELFNNCIGSGSPFDSSPGAAVDDVGSNNSPPVSTSSTGSDRLILHTATCWSGGVWTPNTGYTKRLQPPVGLITTSDKQQVNAGSTGSIMATSSLSDFTTGHIIALVGTSIDSPIGGDGAKVAYLNQKFSLLNAKTSTGVDATRVVALDRVCRSFTFYKTITGVFSALVVAYEGSIDGTANNWFTLGTDSTTAAGPTHVVDKPCLFIRANVTTFTGGTNVSADGIVAE